MAKKNQDEDLITMTEAAELRGYKGVSAISQLIARGRISSVERFGKTLVYRSEVLTYEPDKGGRPPKPKDEAVKGGKKGSNR